MGGDPVETSTPVSAKNVTEKLMRRPKPNLKIRPEEKGETPIVLSDVQACHDIPQTDAYASSSDEKHKPETLDFPPGLKSFDDVVPALSNESPVELFPDESVLPDQMSFAFGSALPKSRTFQPEVSPPSRSDVANSLNECEQLESTGPVPHYSNFKDVTKRMEVGNKVLKVEHHFSGLKTHKSWMNLIGIEDRRKIRLAGSDFPRSSLVRGGLVVLKPMLRPPTRNEVKEWNSKPDVKVIEKTPKVKMLVRAGGDDGSDEGSGDESMTLTPCTPSVLSDTSLNSPTAEEKPEDTCVGLVKSKRRVSFEGSLQDTLRPSGSRRQSLSMIEEDILDRFKKGPFTKRKGRERMQQRVRDGRRLSTDSNKSSDIFGSEEMDKSQKKLSAGDVVNVSSDKDRSCDIRGISLDNTFGFKNSLQNFQNVRPSHDVSVLRWIWALFDR